MALKSSWRTDCKAEMAVWIKKHGDRRVRTVKAYWDDCLTKSINSIYLQVSTVFNDNVALTKPRKIQ